jgi:hypothetical protein
VRALAAAAAVLVAVVRDGGDEGTASRLVDGSLPLRPPEWFDRNAVRGRVLLRPAAKVEPRRLRSCMRLLRLDSIPRQTLVVERVGLRGRSLTFRDPRAPQIYACDASAGTREGAGPWCGASVGRLRAGAVTDPRVDLANCVDASGRAVAFAWVEPRPTTTWLAIDDGDGVEVYRTAGTVPVRITSVDMGDDASSTSFGLTQYTAEGGRLDDRDVTVAVAG